MWWVPKNSVYCWLDPRYSHVHSILNTRQGEKGVMGRGSQLFSLLILPYSSYLTLSPCTTLQTIKQWLATTQCVTLEKILDEACRANDNTLTKHSQCCLLHRLFWEWTTGLERELAVNEEFESRERPWFPVPLLNNWPLPVLFLCGQLGMRQHWVLFRGQILLLWFPPHCIIS